MRVFRLVSVLGPLVALAACASSSGSTSSTSSTPAPRSGSGLSALPEFTPELIAEGKAIYNKRPCAQCHGPNGIGTVNGPNLADKNWIRGEGNYSMIVTLIVNGVRQSDIMGGYGRGMPERGMPINESDQMRMGAATVRMTDAEVKAVAVYVCSLSDCRKN